MSTPEEELFRKIHLAVCDPGAFVPREREERDGETEYESVTHWSARAAMTVMAETDPRAADQPTGETTACRLYDDGEGGTVRIQADKPLTEEGQAAMRELVGAARRRMAADKAAERAEIEKQIRAKVADEITARGRELRMDDEEPISRDEWTCYGDAARIARGES